MSLTAAAIVVATFLTSILSGMFGMAGGLILMGLFAWVMLGWFALGPAAAIMPFAVVISCHRSCSSSSRSDQGGDASDRPCLEGRGLSRGIARRDGPAGARAAGRSGGDLRLDGWGDGRRQAARPDERYAVSRPGVGS